MRTRDADVVDVYCSTPNNKKIWFFMINGSLLMISKTKTIDRVAFFPEYYDPINNESPDSNLHFSYRFSSTTPFIHPSNPTPISNRGDNNVDPMKGMITSYLASPQGQEMIRNYLSSPEGHKAICEFVATPKGRAVMKQVLPDILSVYVPAPGSPGGSRPKTQRNSLRSSLFY